MFRQDLHLTREKLKVLICHTDPCVRVDTGVQAGSSIVASYDSMIAKLIVKGKDRKEAIKHCKMALDKVWIKGTKTTLPFFRMLSGIRNSRMATLQLHLLKKILKNIILTVNMKRCLQHGLQQSSLLRKISMITVSISILNMEKI